MPFVAPRTQNARALLRHCSCRFLYDRAVPVGRLSAAARRRAAAAQPARPAHHRRRGRPDPGRHRRHRGDRPRHRVRPGLPHLAAVLPRQLHPRPVAEVPVIHQAVEFGNRMLTFLVVLTAALAVLAVTRARRRREVLIYAWLMPASTVAQAVIGGITVLTGLLWWTVAIHLLVSMTMVWLAVLLYVKIGEPDDGVPTRLVPKPLRQLTSERGRPDGGARHRHDGHRSRTRTRATRASTAPVPRLRSRSSRWCTCTRAPGDLPGTADRPRLRAARGARATASDAAAGRAADPGVRAGPGRHGAVLHRSPRGAGRGARRGCGRVHRGHRGAVGLDARSGPSPSRSSADSTPSANSRCARSRVGRASS